MNYLKAFGYFWYDFIVGDSVLLAVGGVLVVAIAWGLVELDASKAAEIAAPVIVIGTLWVSLPHRKR
jgi:uncharacterized membrane protein YqgA involved in biofilm formation